MRSGITATWLQGFELAMIPIIACRESGKDHYPFRGSMMDAKSTPRDNETSADRGA
jgi:hypothetical protein